MNKHATKLFKNVCPRNCPSSCTIMTYVENDHPVHIAGDYSHPYTKGKLCAKGFSYLEKNSYRDRLKYPYYQQEKGSGKFKQITWEKAFQLIISEMMTIHKRHGTFLPLALYKGTGNIGVHHFVTDEFFSSLGETTRISSSPSLLPGFKAIENDMGAVKMSDPSTIQETSMVIIWGSNPAATNIHLIPFIIEAKMKGAKIVVIDPLYTQTAELADLYIQLRPSTDGALADLLIKNLIEKSVYDKEFLEKHAIGFDDFFEIIKKIDSREYLLTCDVIQEAFDLLLTWLSDAKVVSYVIGTGLQKYKNSVQTIRSIEALAAVRGDIGKMGGGIFFRCNDRTIFKNQSTEQLSGKNQMININDISVQLSSSQQQPVEMMWISCANPLTQEANLKSIRQFIKDIPFVVTVDQFMTPTAQMSNLVLPTTTQFEEMDIVMSSWHREIALNEKAISPYYESRSEWSILTELAVRLKQHLPNVCNFPIHSSEEEYLNAQFNDKVFELFNIKNISDLKERTATANLPKIAWHDRQFATETGKYQFYSDAVKNGETPTKDYPFWLITPHHPYAMNSQFHFLNLTNEGEAFVGIHPKIAKELCIFNGEVVKVFNNKACIEIKAIFSSQVPKDIVMIYQGWYPKSQVSINDLVSALQTDTFVNVEKF